MGLTATQIEDVKAAVEMYMEEARKAFNCNLLRSPRVEFTVKGMDGGYSDWHAGKINLNPVLLEENFEDYLAHTIPHEVAHFVEHELCYRNLMRFNYRGRHALHHGENWKRIMSALGVPATRCHSYDVSNARVRRQRRWAVACHCTTYEFTTRRRNQLVNGEASYTCRKCHTRLVDTGKEIVG